MGSPYYSSKLGYLSINWQLKLHFSTLFLPTTPEGVCLVLNANRIWMFLQPYANSNSCAFYINYPRAKLNFQGASTIFKIFLNPCLFFRILFCATIKWLKSVRLLVFYNFRLISYSKYKTTIIIQKNIPYHHQRRRYSILHNFHL